MEKLVWAEHPTSGTALCRLADRERGEAMTTFHKWEDVRHELFDEEEIAAIEQGAARRLAAIRLGEIRRHLGLTQAVVAQRMGVRQERVSAIERGEPAASRVS